VHDLLEPEEFMKLNDGRGADIVFDATGNAESMARSFEYAAFAGALVWVGITAKTVPFDDPLFHRRELTLLASRNAIPSDFNRILRLIKEGHLDTRPWITHRTTLEQAPREFAKWSRRGSGVVKAMIEVG
jgi:alcohol dehydrogenase